MLVAILFLAACSSNQESSQEQAPESEDQVESIAAVQVPAVCIWDKISVRETPDAKGNYVTAISVGETLTYLGEDSTNGDKTYAKVMLNDGKEGWALKSFIVNDAKSAVALTDVNLYSRPDLLTKTDKEFKMMDIVASVEVQDEWMKITGRRSGGKWIDEGWVKSENISFDAVDIASAKFAQEALAIEDENERIESLKELINNGDLSGSKFISELQLKLEALTVSEVDDMSEIIDEVEDMAIEEEVSDSI